MAFTADAGFEGRNVVIVGATVHCSGFYYYYIIPDSSLAQ
jgi:hypothetical protein